MSPRATCCLFTDHAGVSPLHYLQTIRLERARQSLAHGASVTHAAEAEGFRSGLHLRRAWGRQWGGWLRDAVRGDEVGWGVMRSGWAWRVVRRWVGP